MSKTSKNNSLKTQNERIIKTLSSGKTLTVAQAKTRGITNLRARISELRNDYGFAIETTLRPSRTSGRNIAVYSLGMNF